MACTICEQAGVDFVKTSTGIGPRGATVQDVELLRDCLDEHVGVKASGGIRTLPRRRAHDQRRRRPHRHQRRRRDHEGVPRLAPRLKTRPGGALIDHQAFLELVRYRRRRPRALRGAGRRQRARCSWSPTPTPRRSPPRWPPARRTSGAAAARELWHKGGTSGNVQRVVARSLDCDHDTVLLAVAPAGPGLPHRRRELLPRRAASGGRRSRRSSRIGEPAMSHGAQRGRPPAPWWRRPRRGRVAALARRPGARPGARACA